METKDNYFLFQYKLEKYYIKSYQNEYEVGDYLIIKGHKEDLEFSSIESQFDFEDYLNKKGIHYEYKITSIEYRFKNPIRIKAWRNSFLNRYDESIRSLIGSILFSYSLDGSVVDNVSSLHIIRLVSASGLYIYLFLKIVGFFLLRILKEKQVKQVSLIVLSFIYLMTFPRLTSLRILIYEFIKYLNKYHFNDKYDHISIISILGLVLLIIDFHNAYSESFIIYFSFSVFMDITNSLYIDMRSRKRKLIRSILSFLFFIPFELQFYSSVSLLSNVFALILTPLFIVFSIFSYIGLLGIPIAPVLTFIYKILDALTSFIRHLNIEIYGPRFNDIGILLFYFSLLIICYLRIIRFKPLEKYGISIFLSINFIHFLPNSLPINEKVYFINVGQGDSCLIQKGNQAVLIDTGGLRYLDIAKESLIPFFKKNKIYDIDYLITTHNDFDHNGGVNSLIHNFKVRNYIHSSSSFPLKAGSLYIDNLNTFTSEVDDDNDRSLVLTFSLANKSFLVTGDAPKYIEEKIINKYKNIDCDILKVGHHGSKTSTSENFIKALKPKEAVISVGENNYGHPNKEVIDILNKYHVKIRRTDIEGTIIYKKYVFI